MVQLTSSWSSLMISSKIPTILWRWDIPSSVLNSFSVNASSKTFNVSLVSKVSKALRNGYGSSLSPAFNNEWEAVNVLII